MSSIIHNINPANDSPLRNSYQLCDTTDLLPFEVPWMLILLVV
jgi:hypothetical protein